MTWISIVAILFCIIGTPFAPLRRSYVNIILLFVMLGLHILACYNQYLFVLYNSGDPVEYYDDPYRLYSSDFKLGTFFVVNLVQSSRKAIGGSFLDYFFMFQTVGFAGILILFRTFEEICADFDVKPTAMMYSVLFVPGLYFWTSSIGKDAPLFTAITLAVWSTLNLSKRFSFFLIALLVMTLFRPYVTLFAIAAIGLAVVFDRRVGTLFRVAASLLGVLFGGYVLIRIGRDWAIDVSSVASLSSFAQLQMQNGADSASPGLVSQSLPMKFLSVFARPFFYDTSGVLGMIASLENLFLFFIIVTILRRSRLLLTIAARSISVRFSLALFSIITLYLGIFYYNAGLNIRERNMLMTPLLVMYLCSSCLLIIQRSRRKSAVLPRARDAAHHSLQPHHRRLTS